MKIISPKFLIWISPVVLLALVMTLPFSSCSDRDKRGRWPLPENELKSLEKTIRNAEKYAKISEERADSLKYILHKKGLSLSRRLEVLRELAAYYRPRMADSALVYANKAHDLAVTYGDTREINRGLLSVADALSASGYFSAAVSTYDSISTAGASREGMITYWTVGRQLYSNMCNYIGEGKGLYERYQAQEDECRDSLIANLPKESPFRTFLASGVSINNGKDVIAREELESVMKRVHKGSQMYGMTAFQLAQTYRRTDHTRYAAYLAMAAESDIMGGITDGFALPSLAEWLYQERHYQEAFKYINFAINDANRGSARMRLVNISSMVPDIDEAYREEINTSLSEFALYAVMVSIILIGLIIFLALIVKEMRKRRAEHSQLASLSKVKDRYIRDFIGLCSAYSEKYDQLAKTVQRKVTAGQAQDLLKLVKYGKASESENEEFYETIDRVFLTLYPQFIPQINTLLRQEEQFTYDPESSTLTPELRIYGFVRLGVTESNKIAKILNYSSNTVYSYRNRMRNKALDRDAFDDEVARIDQEENNDEWGI